jgi:hypothetical protein
MIEVITSYKCPVTGKLWPTEKQAKDCAARARARAKKKLAEEEEAKKLSEEKEFRRNFVRLNAKSPAHAFELLLSKSEEFWGIEFEIPELAGGSYWNTTKDNQKLCSGSIVIIKAEVTDTGLFKKNYRALGGLWTPGISDFLNFIGFETGSGNPGDFSGSSFRMNIYIPFDRFPVINTNFKLMKSDRDKLSQRHNHRNQVLCMAKATASEQPECQEMQHILTSLDELRGDLRSKQQNYIDNFANKYVTEFWDKVNPVPTVNSELQEMFSNVR